MQVKTLLDRTIHFSIFQIEILLVAAQSATTHWGLMVMIFQLSEKVNILIYIFLPLLHDRYNSTCVWPLLWSDKSCHTVLLTLCSAKSDSDLQLSFSLHQHWSAGSTGDIGHCTVKFLEHSPEFKCCNQKFQEPPYSLLEELTLGWQR